MIKGKLTKNVKYKHRLKITAHKKNDIYQNKRISDTGNVQNNILLRWEQDWSRPTGIKEINSKVANKKVIVIIQVRKMVRQIKVIAIILLRSGEMSDVF